MHDRSAHRARASTASRPLPGATQDAARAADDETLAAAARVHLRRHGLRELEPDTAIAPLLARDERLFAIHREVVLDRRQTSRPLVREGVPGDLYLTSGRLIVLGRPVVDICLDQITEVGLAGERLFLVLADGSAAAIDVCQPRLLRVEISAARAAARVVSASGTSVEIAVPGSGLGPVPDSQLVEDAADMVLDGPGGDREGGADLPVG